ncbi:38801_t:CDS:2 [Gigaspora margarita]|uniref:38801_t:CDS:1 n=1 Tax=Gigaspora margarita TaxID=4874 RepID=A0ABN7UP49_GIGMA|nr:38801_t:CDS:2 [Gigaspora margarita]
MSHSSQKNEKNGIPIDTSSYFEEIQAKEGKAKFIILTFLTLLTVVYGGWNVYRMIEAVNSPVVSLRSVIRSSIPVPGIVLCGTTLDRPVLCYKSAFNAADDNYQLGASCNEYLTNDRMDATRFVNMRGFDNLTQQHCYIFNPNPNNRSSGTNSLVFDNSTQKIALALWSNEAANNTLGAITQDRWYFFGTFNELEDPTFVKFQIVKMPAISYIYFNRIEKYDVVKTDALTGGGTSSGAQTLPGATIVYDTAFTSFAIEGFQVDSHLWVLFRIIPSNYVTNVKTNSQEYPVQIWFSRVEFSLFQLAANMGGFISILSAAYFILLGSQRVNPWGVVQRYILKSVPPPPEFGTFASKLYTENSNIRPHDTEANFSNNSIRHTSGSGLSLFNVQTHQSGVSQPDTPEQQLHREYMERYIEPSPSSEMDDPRIHKIRNELRAEVQRTIANELAKLKLFLSKYYLKDVIKIN